MAAASNILIEEGAGRSTATTPALAAPPNGGGRGSDIITSHRTRPMRPPEHSNESPRMEAIHAEFLDNYHRQAHQPDEEEDGTTTNEVVREHPSQHDALLLEDDVPKAVRLASTPSTVTEELQDSLQRAVGVERPHHSGDNNDRKRPIQRKESIDRRLNEAAKFYQAVGEAPPNVGTIIEDDNNDSDSDTDDDAGTVHRIVDTASEEEPENYNLSFEFNAMEGGSATLEPSLPPPSLPQLHKTSKPAHQGQPLLHRTDYRANLSPFKRQSIFHRLPNGKDLDADNFQYKGIQSPPEITQRGVARGNYALLHRKAWLEVTDERHRYGKNLRLYYRKWSSLGHPSNDFFDWLDSKGPCAGQPLPELAECPRSELDSDTVLYIQDSEITKQYALSLDCDESRRLRIFDAEDEAVCTGPDGWIFVLRDNALYGAEKITSVSEHSRQRFHHSSFFGGKAVAAAGIFITNDEGILTRVLPHSGHYRPKEPDMQRMLFFLCNAGADLRLIEVDTQQLNHINRKDPNTFKKKAKKDSLHLSSAATVAHLLSHKARFIGQGIFAQVHQLKHRSSLGSLREALRHVDPAAGGLDDID